MWEKNNQLSTHNNLYTWQINGDSKMWFDIHCTYYTIKQNLPAQRNTTVEKDVDC